jgi:hypothetical protein
VNNLDEDSIINEQEFRAVFENVSEIYTSQCCRKILYLFSYNLLQSVNLFPDDLRLLFGEDCEVMEAFAQVDGDNDGEV